MEVPLSLTPYTPADAEQVSEQLGRTPRDVIAVAARDGLGAVAVIATSPRVGGTEPFPTTFYLTHPVLVKLVSTIEAAGDMADYQAQVSDGSLAEAYARAHWIYLAQRGAIARLAGLDDVPEIAGISAGGMPTRVKCLHALVAHALASGPGINPIGDAVLRRLHAEGTWHQSGWTDTTEEDA